MYFDWIAENDWAVDATIKPLVFVGNVLYMTPAGYTLGGSSWDNGSDEAVDSINVLILETVNTLSDAGLDVVHVDTNSAYKLATDVAADNIHPNDLGHKHIADAFISADLLHQVNSYPKLKMIRNFLLKVYFEPAITIWSILSPSHIRR